MVFEEPYLFGLGAVGALGIGNLVEPLLQLTDFSLLGLELLFELNILFFFFDMVSLYLDLILHYLCLHL